MQTQLILLHKYKYLQFNHIVTIRLSVRQLATAAAFTAKSNAIVNVIILIAAANNYYSVSGAEWLKLNLTITEQY